MVKSRVSSKKKKLLPPKYLLELFITDETPRSILAIDNLKEICRRFALRCDIKLVDLCRNAPLAKQEGIVAVPALVRRFPLPERRVIGVLSDYDRVLSGLGIAQAMTKTSPP